jgi:hypothetical protein
MIFVLINLALFRTSRRRIDGIIQRLRVIDRRLGRIEDRLS